MEVTEAKFSAAEAAINVLSGDLFSMKRDYCHPAMDRRVSSMIVRSGIMHLVVCSSIWLAVVAEATVGVSPSVGRRSKLARGLLQVPSPAGHCPLKFNASELNLLLSLFPKPPKGLPPPPGGGPPGMTTPCNLYTMYTMSKNLRETGQFFLPGEVSTSCVKKLYEDFVLRLPPELENPCGLTTMDSSLFSISATRKCHLQFSSRLIVNQSAIADACSGDLVFNVEQCTLCGRKVIAEASKIIFPVEDCLMAVQIKYTSRLPSYDRWIQIANCIGKESKTIPPLNLSVIYPGAPVPPDPFPGFGGVSVSPAASPLPGTAGVSSSGGNTKGVGGGKHSPSRALIGLSVGGAILLIAAIVIFVAYRQLIGSGPQNLPPMYLAATPTSVSQLTKGARTPGEHSARLKLYSFATLQEATNNFADSCRVGKGGSAEVYRGILLGGKVVAVKKMSKGAIQADANFLNELSVISSISHPNLCALEGYCKCLSGEFVLVYDFMPNGTLEDALFKRGYQFKLSWEQWSYIIVDTARGLDYLHSWNNSNGMRIIHRDIKLANILLDSHFHARLTDFGIARRLNFQQTHLTTRILGTFGYLAPEYASTGWLTEKTDTYSFGVVMLSIISRQEPIGSEGSSRGGLVAEAFLVAREQRLMDIVSPDYAGEYTHVQMERFLSVALLCVQADPVNRPRMSDVIPMLEGRADVPEVYIPIPHSMPLSSLKFGVDGGNTYDTGSSSRSHAFSMSTSSGTDTLCGELTSTNSLDFDNKTESSTVTAATASTSMRNIPEEERETTRLTQSGEHQRWSLIAPLVEEKRNSNEVIDLR